MAAWIPLTSQQVRRVSLILCWVWERQSRPGGWPRLSGGIRALPGQERQRRPDRSGRRRFLWI